MYQPSFHNVIERRGTNSAKWDLTEKLFGDSEVLPMWVADMDFMAPEPVLSAIKDRLDHGIFGYNVIPQSLPDSICGWLKKRHGWEINNQWVTYSPGVVTAMAMAISAFTNPGDKILTLTPVYQPFFHVVERNGRQLVTIENKLIDNHYEIDFEQLEQVLTPDIKMFLLCNPHNPGGTVWSKKDLQRLGELCVTNGTLLLSDDIHSDILVGSTPYTPVASISEEISQQTITFIAPTKTFNLAGLQASAVIIPNRRLKVKFDHHQINQGLFGLNTFGMVGMEAAYLHGEEWLENFLAYIKENISRLKEFLESELPSINMIEPDATYLVWLDCRKLGLSDKELAKALMQKGKIGLEPGPKYGPGGEGFVRINLGCPRETLEEGLIRLKRAFQ
ncbi:MalY/PatB family protein [Litchfieldia salsa]|uniref:cysteine-S-conjugate beta-lyase n=1 Tax=Litchfieldia salsa TaxID=930152 RepID=A0A1H0WYA7_9BACI|nr:PatB family C-S lyase [Litchfieldia salsa]SDP95703.1 cystathione beta-lyase [Litchfieldia salsa]